MQTTLAKHSGKVALVTGAARGIGRATALQLAREGADVVVNYRKSNEAAAAVVREIEGLGRHAIAVEANMADPQAVDALFEQIVRAFDGLDFLICNAAAGHQGTLLEATLKSWDLAMNVNARSLLLCAQKAVPLMKRRGGGRIVAMTARIATERAFPFYGTVAASKAAIHALTTYMAVEFGPYNISVNSISPGVVDTDALHYFRQGRQLLEQAKAVTPLGRTTSAEDVAHLVTFLCSDPARQISGQIIPMDGGYERLFL